MADIDWTKWIPPVPQPNTSRVIVGGTPAVICDRHYLAGERAVSVEAGLAKYSAASVDARINMRMMDLGADARIAPGRPRAFPRLFGGIWRTR